MKSKIERTAIATMPPYAPYLDEVINHPVVSGIRLNTVMPLKESYEEALKRLNNKIQEQGKDLWIDLKCRQLRVKEFGVPPYTAITLSHNIDVYTPCKAYFSSRNEVATILQVDGNKLIMQEGPRRVLGPGESVTITHPTLKIEGYLTDTDKRYIEAANKVGLNKYMLSFVEQNSDFTELRNYVSNAEIVAKIESPKGLQFVKKEFGKDFSDLKFKNKGIKKDRLMAARGDLYMELHYPHEIVQGLELILNKDEDAIVASRLLESLTSNPEPSCEDIGDVDNLLRMGYKTFMFGDEVCLSRNILVSALNVFSLMARRYEK